MKHFRGFAVWTAEMRAHTCLHATCIDECDILCFTTQEMADPNNPWAQCHDINMFRMCLANVRPPCQALSMTTVDCQHYPEANS